MDLVLQVSIQDCLRSYILWSVEFCTSVKHLSLNPLNKEHLNNCIFKLVENLQIKHRYNETFLVSAHIGGDIP